MKKTVFIRNKMSISMAIILAFFIFNKSYAQTMFPVWPRKYAARLVKQIKETHPCNTTKKKNSVRPKKANQKDHPLSDSVFVNRDKKLKDSVLKSWKYK